MCNFVKQIVSQLKTGIRKARYHYRLFRAKNLGPLPLQSSITGPSMLFLLPESGINAYLNTFVSIASQLRLQGYRIYFARCFNIFERCVFMDSEFLPVEASEKEKKFLCTYCFSAFEKKVVKNHFEYIDLRHFILPQDYEKIRQVLRNHHKPFDFSYDDINFSELLEYNLFLFLKKSTLTDLTLSEFKLWQQQLLSLFVGYQAIKRIIQTYKMTHIVMHDQYSLNSVVNKLATKNAIFHANLAYTFHKDIDKSRIRVLRTESTLQDHQINTAWQKFKPLYLSKEQIKEIVDDLVIKMCKKGTYSYSPSKTASINLYEELNLDKYKKTIVAYPSSPDEAESIINSNRKMGYPPVTPDDAFIDQFEWLDHLIEYTENSTDLQLIVRLHPRLSPNHREKWGCAALVDFMAKYAKSYRNVKIVWPGDPISSFDLSEVADLVTIAWSTMGIFMARLGIPVISGIKLSLPVPNEDFIVFCNTKDQYFSKIKVLLHEKQGINQLKHAYRWYHMRYLAGSVDLSDVINDNNVLIKMNKLSHNAEKLSKALIGQENVLLLNLMDLEASQNKQSKEIETRALILQLYRLIHFFMTNSDNFDENNMPIIKVNAVNIEYVYQERSYFKCSPMIVKLSLFIEMLSAEARNHETAIYENS